MMQYRAYQVMPLALVSSSIQTIYTLMSLTNEMQHLIGNNEWNAAPYEAYLMECSTLTA